MLLKVYQIFFLYKFFLTNGIKETKIKHVSKKELKTIIKIFLRFIPMRSFVRPFLATTEIFESKSEQGTGYL